MDVSLQSNGADGRAGHPISVRRERHVRRFAERFLYMEEGAGVIIIDSEFRIVEMSEMVARLFGCRRSDWLNRPVEGWFGHLELDCPLFDRTLLEGCSFANRSFKWGRGEIAKSLMLDGDVLEPNGKGKGAYVLFRDASHLLVLEEQIRRSDRLKTIGQIAAGTAHEIRNPLTAIKGFMQLLQKSLTDKSMAKETEFIGIVMMELERVNDLVSEFLLLSKPKKVKLQSIRIGSIIQELLPMIRGEAMLHDVIVQYEEEESLPPIVVDKEQLKQVFLNLSKNAIEAMGNEGTLTIRERRRADRHGHIAVDIQDTGTGISPDMLERVFDPFFTTKPQGTGLGLSICQRIVHDMGGSIEAESEPSGTTFTVWLPFSHGSGGAVSRDDV
ncbi:nitrogen regulation protein NR(II) [Cohnella faecalis]|uniref:histidine kinase n=1 Tax=Cohnella faecalis TaxID=2315694 RepID=A0A398CEB0_9BACL|nr:ATP-binding protein [Cohnella faecalis]RIE01043.1 PAS domain-containing sensor histidine kinase [Cohnella faecalis]